jgi:hypothetical protein
MSASVTTASNDLAKAVAALPLALNTVGAIQADVSAAHQTVVSAGLAVASTIASSLTALANSGDIGKADAANVTAGVSSVESALGLAGELEAVIAKIRGAFSWL